MTFVTTKAKGFPVMTTTQPRMLFAMKRFHSLVFVVLSLANLYILACAITETTVVDRHHRHTGGKRGLLLAWYVPYLVPSCTVLFVTGLVVIGLQLLV